MQRDGCVGQHLPTFRTGQAVKMKNINYYGQKITVSDEVAEFWSRIVYGKVLNEEVTSVTWISLGMKFTQCPVCS